MYGRIAPAAGRRGLAEPAYMKTVATLLRSGHRPPLGVLHEQAVGRIPEETRGNLLLADAGASYPRAALYGRLTYRRPPCRRPGRARCHPHPHPPTPPVPAPRSDDPHAAIAAAVRAGRHGRPTGWPPGTRRRPWGVYGPASEQAWHWSEVRADLAMFAGDAVRSCRAWLAVAEARLAAGQAVDAPAVETAVDRAHHQWTRIKDTARARELGPALAELRLRVPGRRRGALENVQRQLRQLQGTP